MNEQNGKYIEVSHQRRRRPFPACSANSFIPIWLLMLTVAHHQTVGLLKVRTKVNTVYYLHTADARPALPNYCVSFHSNRKNGGRKVLGVFVRKEKCNMRCPLDGGSRQIWRLLEFLKINLWKIKMEIDIYWENLKLAPMRQNVLQNFPFTDNFVLNINFIYAPPRKF